MTNICRCGTYNRVRAAIKLAADGGSAGEAELRRSTMTTALDVSRRNFLVGSAAAAGGLSLGFHVPLRPAPPRPQGAARRRSTPGW